MKAHFTFSWSVLMHVLPVLPPVASTCLGLSRGPTEDCCPSCKSKQGDCASPGLHLLCTSRYRPVPRQSINLTTFRRATRSSSTRYSP
ncbi:hypothetical protein EDB92DRAFT_866842 [Lactarius akahatsu]|uniref:Secreted protein n=1 Tax=Lactarius akahatsu TaxID=416441 RepID=A0AAD4LEH8_9AGAM|nr:hypothetical protein EDB92DRAFT_866842 [Lactarius akahatsu]